MNLKCILTPALLLVLLSPATGQESHTVQPNQTLYSIARLYNVSVDQLRTWNNLENLAIRVGQSLVVKPAAPNANLNPGLNPFLYTVRTGDSLTALSLKFDTPLGTLKRLNSLDADQGLPQYAAFTIDFSGSVATLRRCRFHARAWQGVAGVAPKCPFP